MYITHSSVVIVIISSLFDFGVRLVTVLCGLQISYNELLNVNLSSVANKMAEKFSNVSTNIIFVSLMLL